MKDISELLKKAQVLQGELAEALKKIKIEATAGGGMVKVVADGEQNILEIKIDPEVVSKDDIPMLEDLILAAVNEAKRKAAEAAKQEIQKIAGFPLPGML
jgi:DNA-binding YbaB/EbfC family protein